MDLKTSFPFPVSPLNIDDVIVFVIDFRLFVSVSGLALQSLEGAVGEGVAIEAA